MILNIKYAGLFSTAIMTCALLYTLPSLAANEDYLTYQSDEPSQPIPLVEEHLPIDSTPSKGMPAHYQEAPPIKGMSIHYHDLPTLKGMPHHHPEPLIAPIIIHGNDFFSLQIYGHVNQGIMIADDGRDTNVFFVTTNDNSISRLGFIAKYEPHPGLTISGHYEMGFQINRSNRVSQTEESLDDGIDLRKVEIIIDSEHYGILSLGQGSMASDKTAKQDLSGTKVVANSNASKIGGGLFFRTRKGTLTEDEIDPVVGAAFNNIDGFKRKSRVRYDTPYWKGFSLSASAGEEDSYDAALRYKQEFSRAKVKAAVAYTKSIVPLAMDEPTVMTEDCRDDVDDCLRDHGIDGSGSILLNNGLNVTLAGGYLEPRAHGRDTAYYKYMKLGYILDYFHIGDTACSIDYGFYRNFSGNDHRGNTTGLAIVQEITAWNLSVYAGTRKFTLSTPQESLKDIYVTLFGALFAF